MMISANALYGGFLESFDQPIIGILTQASDYKGYPGDQYSYIAASYVKFVESSGARVVPIPYEANNTVLEEYFQKINGLLVPGGDVALIENGKPSQFTKALAYLTQRAIDVNSAGEVFPIYAVCMGFQALHIIIAGYKEDVLFQVFGESAINHAIQNPLRTANLYKDLNDNLFNSLATDNVVYYNHHWAVSPNSYTKYPSLNSFFRITGYNTDEKGQLFIASAESKKYPILAVQYHPEKMPFEWNIPANHTLESVQITQNHGDTFVDLARQSNHRFDSQQLASKVIYNYQAIQIDGSSFVQLYFFKNGQL
ncbi:hypothetical protein pb186bvf_015670 [Paramecium bursaria]